MLRQIRQRHQQSGAVALALAHADNTTGTDLHTGLANIVERLEAVLIGAGGDDLAIELRRGIQIVVVIVEPSLSQLPGLLIVEHTQRHAGL